METLPDGDPIILKGGSLTIQFPANQESLDFNAATKKYEHKDKYKKIAKIVVKDEMPMQACILSQAALADWKAHSIYAGEQWTIGRIKCVPGDYAIKGAA